MCRAQEWSTNTAMEPLSLQIQDIIADKDVYYDRKHKQRVIWIWTLLLRRQSAALLQNYLQDIEDTLESNRLNTQELLELGWKAEALELLLHQQEPEPVPAPV